MNWPNINTMYLLLCSSYLSITLILLFWLWRALFYFSESLYILFGFTDSCWKFNLVVTIYLDGMFSQRCAEKLVYKRQKAKELLERKEKDKQKRKRCVLYSLSILFLWAHCKHNNFLFLFHLFKLLFIFCWNVEKENQVMMIPLMMIMIVLVNEEKVSLLIFFFCIWLIWILHHAMKGLHYHQYHERYSSHRWHIEAKAMVWENT